MTNNHLLLYRLTELMLMKNKHILELDDLFEDEKIGDYVKSIQIDSPYQQMLLEGVLTESVIDEKLCVSFTVEGYFHHMLGEVIYDMLKGNSSNYLYQLIQSNQLNGIHEGISNCLLREVAEEKYSNLLDLMNSTEIEHYILIKPIAAVFSIGDLSVIIENLKTYDIDKNYSLILKALDYLQNNNRYNVVDKFWDLFSNKINPAEIFKSSFYKSLLFAKGLLFIPNKGEINKICESLSFESNQDSSYLTLFEKQLLALELKNILVSKGMLKQAFEFSNRIGLYHFPEQLLADNYYNILYPLLELGEFEKAEMIYKKCYSNNRNNGHFINWSGWIYQSWYELKSKDLNHLLKGIELYQIATGLIDSDFGKYSIIKYQNLENLGYALSLNGEHEKSCQYLDEAIMIIKKSYKTDTTYLLGNTYGMKAVSLNFLGKYEEALEYSFKSDECKLLQTETDSPEMAWNYHDRFQIYLNMGKKREAKNSLKKALKIRESSLGIDNVLTLQTKKELDELF